MRKVRGQQSFFYGYVDTGVFARPNLYVVKENRKCIVKYSMGCALFIPFFGVSFSLSNGGILVILGNL